MTNIVSFDERLKGKSTDRPSDVIFKSLNRFYDAKLSGAVTEDELSEMITLIGDIFANKIKQRRVSPEEIEQAEAFLTGFTGENKDKYFTLKHKDLDRASKMFIEGDYFAMQSVEQRKMQSQPIFDEESYTKGFRRI